MNHKWKWNNDNNRAVCKVCGAKRKFVDNTAGTGYDDVVETKDGNIIT